MTVIRWEASTEVHTLTRDLAVVPDEIRGRLRPALRSAGQRVLDRARANASWSTRIPRAMSLRIRLAGDRPGAIVTVNTTAAPHGRPYEDILGRGAFRHPVFGNRNVWVTQAARPYLWPAATTEAPSVERDVRDAINKALNAHNL